MKPAVEKSLEEAWDRRGPDAVQCWVWRWNVSRIRDDIPAGRYRVDLSWWGRVWSRNQYEGNTVWECFYDRTIISLFTKFPKVTQAVAQKFGIPMEKVRVKPYNNLVCPNAMVTGGSTTSELCAFVSLEELNKSLQLSDLLIFQQQSNVIGIHVIRRQLGPVINFWLEWSP
jgi:hypothetical protein